MKKALYIICIVFLLVSLAGCSTQASSQKSEEELRAEIKAEMEAEAKKDQGQNDQQEPEQKPKGEPVTFKTFEDLYDGTHLTPVIEYFDKNYDGFSEDIRKEFAQKIVDTIQEQSRMVYESLIMGLNPDHYVLEDSTISVNRNGDQYLLETLKDLENTKLLVLAKKYWASSDNDGVSDQGFILTLHPDFANKLTKALDIVYPQEAPEYHSLAPILIPNVHYTSMDKPFHSREAIDKGYAQVYIEDSDQLKLFENENVWKTTVTLPIKVKYVDEEPTPSEEGKLYLSNLKNGDSIGGGLVIKDIQDLGNKIKFNLIGNIKLTGQILWPITDRLTFTTVDFPATIVIDEAQQKVLDFSCYGLTFKNEDDLKKMISPDDLTQMKKYGKYLTVTIEIRDIEVIYDEFQVFSSLCEFTGDIEFR